jgi:shikimate kinase
VSKAGGAKVRSPNLILTGFMGVGKSTIGRILAERTRARFVDLDAEIESRTGKSVAQIIEEQGEQEFRRIEASTLRLIIDELREAQGWILSLGGGTLLDPGNAQILLQHGSLVYLEATPQALESRLGQDLASRPLLRPSLQPLASLIKERLHARMPGYLQSELRISTDSMSADQVADAILLRAKTRESEAALS